MDITDNLEDVQARMRDACQRVGRDLTGVELIAVSKTFPVESLQEAMAAGQRVFGESRLQEAETKMVGLPSDLSWHFIGRVQRNKVRKILPLFGVIHAVDSLRLAGLINEIAVELDLFPRVFLQVNIGGEESKGGFTPEGLCEDLDSLLHFSRLEILGLMTIPPLGPDGESARRWYVMLRELRDELVLRGGAPLPGLSMGMSGDFEVAIEEGATHVRVGSSVFGRRN